MKAGRFVVLILAAISVAAAGDSVFAAGRGGSRGGGHSGHGGSHGGGHHYHHFSTGVFIGAPFYFYPRYYYPGAYYYPPPPPGPTYYTEQPQQGYWHYCPSARAYYPQVQTCPGGWQLVAPQPRTGY